MSCAYDVHCIDCDSVLGVDDANHADVAMWQLAREANALADVARLMERIGDAYPQFQILYKQHINLEWFEEHRGHRLNVIDEYGTEYDDVKIPRSKSQQT